MIYNLRHPFFEQFKINDNPWPWEEEAQKWSVLKQRTTFFVMFNNFVTFPLFVALPILIKNDIPIAIEVDEMPDFKRLVVTILFCMICEDFGFWAMHKLLHVQPLYNWIHKVHHDHYTPFNIANEHQHPLEFAFGSVLPGTLALLILQKKMHFVSQIIWTVIRVTESSYAHCGLELPWTPYRLFPFMVAARYHDFHHSHNIGNYASRFIFWDLIFGDNIQYYQFLKDSERKKKKLLKESDSDSYSSHESS